MRTDDRTDPLVELGYEQRDIHPKNIFKVTMIFFGFAFVSYIVGALILHWGYDYFKPIPNVNDLKSSKIPAEPNPVLQTNVTAKTDMKDMRQHENAELTSFGPSSNVKGAFRIPIEQAIKLAAERGAKLSAAEAGGAQ